MATMDEAKVLAHQIAGCSDAIKDYEGQPSNEEVRFRARKQKTAGTVTVKLLCRQKTLGTVTVTRQQGEQGIQPTHAKQRLVQGQLWVRRVCGPEPRLVWTC